MPGVTEREAVNHFLTPLRQSLSCVTREVLFHLDDYRTGNLYAVTLGRGDVSLRGRALSLHVQFRYRIGTGESRDALFKVFTESYWYGLKDGNGQPIIAYHWDPQNERVAFPHIHLGAGARVGRAELQKCHIPSGRVALEGLLRMAVEDFGAQPLRDDWSDVLQQTQGAFEQFRSWE